MRRKDREMDREFGLKVIDKAVYGVLSMIDENNDPYCIPLSIVREGNTLYFHSARDGKKVQIFSNSPRVCITFVGETRIPENLSKEELNEIIKDETKAGIVTSKVFTTEFESAVVSGKVKLVERETERINALRLVCEKYTPSKMDYFSMAVKSGLNATNIYSVEIEEISAKRKKFDKNGEELKWGNGE